jgi:hypothetical protein
MLHCAIVTFLEKFPLPSTQPLKSYPYLVGVFNTNVGVSIVYLVRLVSH